MEYISYLQYIYNKLKLSVQLAYTIYDTQCGKELKQRLKDLMTVKGMSM